MSRTVRHALALALVLGAIALAFAAVIGPERGLATTEHLLYFRPRWFHAVRALRSGELPVLTPASAVGLPFEQRRSGLYTPSTLLFFALPFDLAYDLHVVLCFAILAAGAYVLAVRLGARPLPAATAAAIAALAGPTFSHHEQVTQLIGLAWTPWVWVALDRLLVKPDARASGLLAIALGFHLQGAGPIAPWLHAGALVLLAAHRGLAVRAVLALAAGVAVGGGIAALGVMPSIEAAREASLPMPSTERAFEATRLVELFAPAMWLPEEPGGIVGRRFATIYLGCALPLLALSRRDWTSLALIAAFGAGLWMAVAAPSQSWLLLSTAALAACAGRSLGRLGAHPERLAAAALAQVFVLATAASVILSPEFERWLGLTVFDARSDQRLGGLGIADIPFGFFEPPEHPRSVLVAAMSGRLLHAGVFTAGALVLAFVMAYRPARRGALAPLIPLLVIADLATGDQRAVFAVPLERLHPPPDVAAALGGIERRVFAVPDRRFADSEPPPLQPELVEARASQDAVRGMAGAFDVRRLNTASTLDVSPDPWSRRVAQVVARTPGDRLRTLLERSGASWLSTWLTTVRAELAMVYDVDGETPESVYRLGGARPYVKAYTRWMRANPFLLADEQLRAALSDPALSDVALIPDNTTPVDLEVPPPPSPCDPAPAAVLLEGSSQGDLSIDVAAGCAVLVVAAEHTMPGWRASVDGVSVAVEDVEVGFLGAWVPAGKHRLRFRYAGFSGSWAETSAAALAIALLLIALPAARKRRDGAGVSSQ